MLTNFRPCRDPFGHPKGDISKFWKKERERAKIKKLQFMGEISLINYLAWWQAQALVLLLNSFFFKIK
jgi:hypothetical protein